MRRLRASGIPALLLALVSGVAAVAPEAGHSRAHRDGHAAPAHDAVQAGDGAVVDHGHASGVHPHADLCATPPARTPIPHSAIVRTAVDLDALIATEPRVVIAVNHGLPPPEQAQAPPPLSRAPPRS